MRLYLLILLFIPTLLWGQTVKKYRFKNFDSYIFLDKENPYDIKDMKEYFILDSLEILKIETEIIKQKETFNSIKGRKRGLTKFDRQYFGYLKNNGERIAIICFINTDNGVQGKKMKKTIDEKLVIGFGDWFENNTFRLSYNLTTNQLREY